LKSRGDVIAPHPSAVFFVAEKCTSTSVPARWAGVEYGEATQQSQLRCCPPHQERLDSQCTENSNLFWRCGRDDLCRAPVQLRDR